jgi:AcrR family transcriptional regulator
LLLSREGLAGGSAPRLARDELIAGIEGAVAAKQRRARPVDLPVSILLGGILRLVAMRLTDGPVTRAIGEEIADWVRMFAPAGSARWVDFRLAVLAHETSDAFMVSGALRNLPTRERLLRGTAAAILRNGYRATRVIDIVAAAGVSRRSFHDHFTCKKAALLETYEFAFAMSLNASLPSFFASADWPQRVWKSAQAFSAFFAAEPSFAHLGFVECYGLGSDLHARLRDTQLAFTTLLHQDGEGRNGVPRSRVSAECTALVIFEAGYSATRAAPSRHLRSMQPLAVYVALMPFIGAEGAQRFIASRLERQRRRSTSGPLIP